MKIFYAYHEYYDRHSKFADVMRDLGHVVVSKETQGKSNPGQIGIQDVNGGFDLVWLLSPACISNKVITDSALSYIKSKDIPIAIYSTFRTSIPYTEMIDVWDKIDYAFVMNKRLAGFLSDKGLGGYYVPMGFHPDQYFLEERPSKYDITFMGSTQSTRSVGEDKRVQYLQALAEKNNLEVFGGRFNKRGVKSNLYSTHKEQRIVYTSSKINLDLPFVNSPHPFYENMIHIKNRFFEIPATNSFLLTLRHPDFTEILDESMVGYFDDDPDSLIESANKFLNDDELRNKMAKRAYNEIVKHHSYAKRFEHMIDIVNGRKDG